MDDNWTQANSCWPNSYAETAQTPSFPELSAWQPPYPHLTSRTSCYPPWNVHSVSSGHDDFAWPTEQNNSSASRQQLTHYNMSGARAPYYPTIPTHTSSMYGNAARGVPPSGNAPSCNIHSHSYDMQCDISSTLSAPMIDQPSQVGNVGYNELMPFEPKVPPARPIAVPRQRYARQNFSTSYQVAGTALTQQVSSHRCQAVYRRTTLGEPALGGGQDTWSNTGSGLDPLHQDPEHVSRRNIAFTYAAEAPTASYSDIACQSVQDKRSVTHPFKRTENIAKSHKPVGCNKGPKKGRGRPGRPCFIVTDTKDGLRWERCPSTNDAGVILNLLPNSITKGLSNEDKLNREVTRPIKKDKQVSKVNRAKVPASKQGGRQAVLRTLAPEPIAGR